MQARLVHLQALPGEYLKQIADSPAWTQLENKLGDVLKQLGHKVHWWADYTWLAGAPCTIVVDHKTGILHGGADPRRPAYVLGW